MHPEVSGGKTCNLFYHQTKFQNSVNVVASPVIIIIPSWPPLLGYAEFVSQLPNKLWKQITCRHTVIILGLVIKKSNYHITHGLFNF